MLAEVLTWPDSIAFLGVMATIGIAIYSYLTKDREMVVRTPEGEKACATKEDTERLEEKMKEHHDYTREAFHRTNNSLDLTNKSLAILLDRFERPV